MNFTRELMIYWLPYAACIAIVVVCVYYTWKSIFADRPRGRRRCPKCWYDMAYSEGMTCSECGHAVQSESAFTSTRRHYGRAAIAMFLCVFTILGAYWKLADRGFIASMPTPVLIMSMPFVSDAGSRVFTHLSRRMFMGQITDEQSGKIVIRCANGDWFTAPPDDAWINKYGTFLGALRSRLQSRRAGRELHPLELHLLDIPPRVFFDVRQSWPAGAPARIRVRNQDWWPLGYECRLTITSLDDPTDTRTIEQRPLRGGANAYILMSQPLDKSITSLNYEVTVHRRRSGDPAQDWIEVEHTTMTLPITVHDTLENSIAGVSDAAMDDAMKNVFGGVTKWTGGPQPVRFTVRAAQTFIPQFENTAVGISVELLREGVVARQLDLWWIGGDQASYRGYEHDVPYEDNDLLLSISPEDFTDRWTLRVRSDPNLALRAGDVERYWKGTFEVEMTLNEVPNDVTPKVRNWWVEVEGEEPTDEEFTIEG